MSRGGMYNPGWNAAQGDIEVSQEKNKIGTDTKMARRCEECIYGQSKGKCTNPKGLCGIGEKWVSQ